MRWTRSESTENTNKLFNTHKIFYLQIRVSGHKEEVIIDELLSDLLAHTCEGKVGSGQIPSQVSKGLLHEVLHSKPLVLGNAWRQSEAVNTATNSNTSGVDWSCAVNVPLDLAHVHVAGVLALGGDAMVVLDDGVEHLREDLQ